MKPKMKKNRGTKASENVVFLSGYKGVVKNMSPREEDNNFYSIFKYAIDSNEDAVAIFDLQGVIDFVNKPFVELFRYVNREELQGLKIENFFGPNETKTLRSLIQKPEISKVVKLQEVGGITKSGESIPVAIYSFIIFNRNNEEIGLICSIRDISERKSAEQKLKEREERYHAIYDNSLDMIYLTDLQGGFIDANSSALNALGYEKEEMGKINFASFLSADQMPLALRTMQEIMETGTLKKPVEYKVRTKSGGYIFIESIASLVCRDGKPYAIQGIARDITARKRDENELRRYAEEIKDLYNNAPCGYQSLDKDGTFIQINDTMLQWLGYSRDEIIGKKKLSDLITPDDLQNFQRYFPILKKEGQLRDLETNWVRKDGTIVPMLLNSTAVKNAAGEYLYDRSTTFDITRRKRAEQEVRESEAKYHMLADNSTDTIITVDLNLNYTYVSPSIRALRGFTPEEVMGQPVDQSLTPESFKVVPQTLAEELENEKRPDLKPDRTRTLQLEQLCKDGSIIWTENTLRFLRDPAGNIIGILGIMRDISERIAAEKEKQKLLVSLAQSEKLASLGQFAAGMAHEINNPLAYIRANLKVLDEYRKNLHEILNLYEKLSFGVTSGFAPAALERTNCMISELVQKIELGETLKDFRCLLMESQEGVDRIKSIIQSLGRISEPPKELPELADINSIVGNILDLMQVEILKKAELVKEFGELPMISCHPEELGQVFIGIISNALNAIPQKGMIKISTEADAELVRVKIQDTGVGMAPELLNRIFDPFFSGKGVGSGKGLGLTVSDGIVRKHGGEIKVESEPGKGSTFIIELPMKS